MIKELCKKYEELIIYFIVGVCSTIVSIVSYLLFRLIINNYLICTVLSWVVAVIFAYFANRIFVFKSKDKNILKEFLKFIFARVLSLLAELLVMFILVDLVKVDDRISKLIVQIIVLVLNYIFSKLFVFRKK